MSLGTACVCFACSFVCLSAYLFVGLSILSALILIACGFVCLFVDLLVCSFVFYLCVFLFCLVVRLLAGPSACWYFWLLRLSVRLFLVFFCFLFFFLCLLVSLFIRTLFFCQVRVGKLCIFGQQREGGAARGGNPLRHD